jgi:tRNA(His) 5'-end guanylyltransferase
MNIHNIYRYHRQTIITNDNGKYKLFLNYQNNDDLSLIDFLTLTFCSLLMFSLFLCLMRFLVFSLNFLAKKRKNIPIELGERMKYYEEQSRKLETVPNNKPFIIRLDGRAFSNFTKKYKQISKKNMNLPYSKEFKHAMLLTANDLLQEFQCSTVYTHSDEITLIFNNKNPESQYIFDGKVYKLLSLIPSFASGSFMLHFSEELLENGIIFGDVNQNTHTHTHTNSEESNQNSRKERLTKKLIESNKLDSIPTFDARIIVFPPKMDYEIVNHMIWRSRGDCTRNFISLYAETYIGKKNILGMSNQERLEKLKEIGYDLNSDTIDYSLKHGTFLKYNSDNNEVEFYVFKNISFTNNIYTFLTEKRNYELPKEQETKLLMLVYNHMNYGELFDF